MTQQEISSLYQTSRQTITEHISRIFKDGELDSSTCRKFRQVQNENELEVNSVVRFFRITASDGKIYNIKHYNLDMIIAIGYRVRSNIRTNFRKWATETLKEYMTKGFALNDDLLKETVGGRYFSISMNFC